MRAHSLLRRGCSVGSRSGLTIMFSSGRMASALYLFSQETGLVIVPPILGREGNFGSKRQEKIFGHRPSADPALVRGVFYIKKFILLGRCWADLGPGVF